MRARAHAHAHATARRQHSLMRHARACARTSTCCCAAQRIAQTVRTGAETLAFQGCSVGHAIRAGGRTQAVLRAEEVRLVPDLRAPRARKYGVCSYATSCVTCCLYCGERQTHGRLRPPHAKARGTYEPRRRTLARTRPRTRASSPACRQAAPWTARSACSVAKRLLEPGFA